MPFTKAYIKKCALEYTEWRTDGCLPSKKKIQKERKNLSLTNKKLVKDYVKWRLAQPDDEGFRFMF